MSIDVRWQSLLVNVIFFLSMLAGPIWLGGARWEVIPVLTIPYICGWLSRSSVGDRK